MVAKIVTGKSIRGILEYNESKVQQGTAKLILASGFAMDIDQLIVNQKLLRFTKLNQLNPAVRTNAMHISLNFDPSERMIVEKMQQIAQAYMEKIGFGDQPYLVYSHQDAGHPHLHIATNIIGPDGKRKHTHDIGRLVSEPARKQIEQEFGLVRAEGRKLAPTNYIRPVVYGEKPIKQAVGSVLIAVIGNYHFSSVAEFNAILGSFNIRAETGSRDSVMLQKGGLLYTVLDTEGRPIGVPMKASSFHFKPTLANLDKKFGEAVVHKKKFREELKGRIDSVMAVNGLSDSELFRRELVRVGIDLIVRKSVDGRIYGLTYVDHRQRVVFNGSDLGKVYAAGGSVGAIMAKSRYELRREGQLLQSRGKIALGNPMKDLLQKTEEMLVLPFPKKRKRKKRKGRNL